MLLNKKLQQAAFRDLQESKHWLSLYGHGATLYKYDNFTLIWMLIKPLPEDTGRSPAGITSVQVQDYICAQAQALLLCPEPERFISFMAVFRRRYQDDFEKIMDARPLVKRIIALIDSLRTPNWQRNPHRQPTELPSTLKHRLWLLPYPKADSPDPEQCNSFAQALTEFVAENSGPGKTYHDALPEVKEAAERTSKDFQAEVACLLGTLKESMGTADLLCLEIAEKLFTIAGPPINEAVIEKSREIIESWTSSENEWIRKKGMCLLDTKDAFFNRKRESSSLTARI